MASRKPRPRPPAEPTVLLPKRDDLAAREAARLYDEAIDAGDEPDGLALARISEPVLAREWLTPEEDAAWHGLSKAN